MLFNSWAFAAFFVIVLALYYALAFRWQNVFFLVASYTFYGMWDWRFLGLLWTSTVVDFLVAHALSQRESASERRMLLGISLATNLGILGFFKYFNFFVDSAADLLAVLGFQSNVTLLQIVLPVGISFYTFQTLAYTIDVYRGAQKPTRDWWRSLYSASMADAAGQDPKYLARRGWPVVARTRLCCRNTHVSPCSGCLC